MPISVNSNILQMYELNLYAALLQPLDIALVILVVIACLACHEHYRNSLQVCEFARRLLLAPAGYKAWTIRLVLENNLQFRWVANRRVIMNGNAGQAPSVAA